MNLDKAKEIADDLIGRLPGEPWKIEWMQGRQRYGVVYAGKRLVRFSEPFAAHATKDEFLDVVIHEMAHCLTPGHKHDAVWKDKARELGMLAEPTSYTKMRNPPPKRWIGTCPVCGWTEEFQRLGSRGCPQHGGAFHERYRLTYVPNPAYEEAS